MKLCEVKAALVLAKNILSSWGSRVKSKVLHHQSRRKVGGMILLSNVPAQIEFNDCPTLRNNSCVVGALRGIPVGRTNVCSMRHSLLSYHTNCAVNDDNKI